VERAAVDEVLRTDVDVVVVPIVVVVDGVVVRELVVVTDVDVVVLGIDVEVVVSEVDDVKDVLIEVETALEVADVVV